MKLVEASGCTGCGACIEACPRGAIAMRDDDAGFPTPTIDEEKCVNCALCNRICPAMHEPDRHPVQAAYAAQYRDREVLKDSTSGGIFTALSREIFGRGGAVYGCVWDEQCNAVVCGAEREEDIAPMRGSKYVWSWAGDTFPQIREKLEAGQTVLFSGLPCQVAGLKNYLRRDYDNLFLLDFLCSGAPSPLALQKYLETICDSPAQRKGLNLKFRDKEPYGVGVHITYTGKKDRTKPRGEHITNPYYYSFYTRLVDRQSCYRCRYGTDQRIADLTMGDYWGIADYHRDMDIRAGVSALLVNTDKGAALLNAIRDQLELRQTKAEHIAAANNLACNGAKRTIHRPVKRDAFFAELKRNGWRSAERKYLRDVTRLKHRLQVMVPTAVMKKLKKIKKSIRN